MHSALRRCGDELYVERIAWAQLCERLPHRRAPEEQLLRTEDDDSAGDGMVVALSEPDLDVGTAISDETFEKLLRERRLRQSPSLRRFAKHSVVRGNCQRRTQRRTPDAFSGRLARH